MNATLIVICSPVAFIAGALLNLLVKLLPDTHCIIFRKRLLYDVANVPAGTGDEQGRYALTFLTEPDHGIPMAYICLIEKLAHANALMAAELVVRRAMQIAKNWKPNCGNSLLASCHLGRHLLDPGYARLHRGSTLRRLNFKFTWASWVDVDVALVLSPLV